MYLFLLLLRVNLYIPNIPPFPPFNLECIVEIFSKMYNKKIHLMDTKNMESKFSPNTAVIFFSSANIFFFVGKQYFF